jgi:Tfp pilus assembly protein PilN
VVPESLEEEHTAERIQGLLNVKTTLWRPFDHIKHKLGDMETALQSKLSVPLGLGLSMSKTLPKLINFRKEEFRTESALDIKRMLAVTVSAALILVVLFSFGVFHRVYTQGSRYENLKEQVRQVFLDTFPETRQIVKGQELIQMRQKIQQQSAKFQWLVEMTQGSTALEVMMALTQNITSFKDVRIDNLSIEEIEINVDGRASSFETVDRLKEKLTNAGVFESVKLAGAKTDKKEKVVKFNFGLEKSK